MGALEGAQALATGRMTTLSEQNIIDCSGIDSVLHTSIIFFSYCIGLFSLYCTTVPYGNLGCNGGNVYDAFLYVIANAGIDTNSYYPYEGRVSRLSVLTKYIHAVMRFECHVLRG